MAFDDQVILAEDETPEEEFAELTKRFGMFASSKMEVDPVEGTVTVTVDDALVGKRKIVITEEIPAAAWMVCDEVAKDLNAQIKKLHEERKAAQAKL
jgi:hypothetical protein